MDDTFEDGRQDSGARPGSDASGAVAAGITGSFRVGPLTYQIALEAPSDPAYIGKVLASDLRLQVSPKLAKDRRLVTLAHEIVHTWLLDSGVTLSKAKMEGVCDVIGFHLIELLAQGVDFDVLQWWVGDPAASWEEAARQAEVAGATDVWGGAEAPRALAAW